MLIKKKVLFLLVCITVLPLILTGCYDLGDATEDDDDYCDTYSEIRVIDGSAEIASYSMKDFYNKEAVNDFASPMDEDDRSEYSYLMIKVEKDLSLGNIAVFFDSTVEETLIASFFVLNESDLPTKVYTGPFGRYKKIESNEPNYSLSVGKASCSLRGVVDKWDAAFLYSWSDGEQAVDRYSIREGQYIVMRIDNNCYDPASELFDEAEAEWNRILEEYNQKLAEWQAISNDSGATQEQRDAAYTALSQALTAKNVGERDYELARQEYQKNKFPYKKVPVRMTAILINAE